MWHIEFSRARGWGECGEEPASLMILVTVDKFLQLSGSQQLIVGNEGVGQGNSSGSLCRNVIPRSTGLLSQPAAWSLCPEVQRMRRAGQGPEAAWGTEPLGSQLQADCLCCQLLQGMLPCPECCYEQLGLCLSPLGNVEFRWEQPGSLLSV